MKVDRGSNNIINLGSIRYTYKSVTILAVVTFLSGIVSLLFFPFTSKFPFIWPVSGLALAGLMGSKKKLFVYTTVINFLVMAVSRGLIGGNWRWNVALSILEIFNVVAIALILRSLKVNRYIFTHVRKINIFLSVTAVVTIFCGLFSIFIQPVHIQSLVGLEWALWIVSVMPSLWIFTPLILSYFRRFERVEIDGTIIMKPRGYSPQETLWAIAGSIALSIILLSIEFSTYTGLLIILLAVPLMLYLATRLDSLPFMIVLAIVGEASIAHVYLHLNQFIFSDPEVLANLFTAKLFFVIFSGTLIIISVLIRHLEHQKNFVFRGRQEFAANFLNSHLGMFHTDLNGEILRVNKTFKDMLSFETDDDVYQALSADPMAIFYNPDDLATYRQLFTRPNGWAEQPIRMRSKFGEMVPVEITGRPWMEHSEQSFVEVIVTDQRQILVQSSRLTRSEESLRLATEASGIGVWEEHASEGGIYVNSVFERWFPVAENSSQTNLRSLRPNVDPAMLPVYDQLMSTIDSGYLDFVKTELRMHANGLGWRTFIISGNRIQNTDGSFSSRWIGTIIDISEQKARMVEVAQTNQNLRRQLDENNKMRDLVIQNAVRDPNTNLFTKNYLEDWFKARVNSRNRSPNQVRLIMLEIDKGAGLLKEFKHEATRQILIILADILRQNFKGTDQIGKLKTYTFAILTEEEDEELVALHLNQTIADMDAAMLNHFNRTLKLRSCEIFYPQNATTWEELIERAEKSLSGTRI